MPESCQVAPDRPWIMYRESDKAPVTAGRYEITVEDPFDNSRSVSIAFYDPDRIGKERDRWCGPSPSMVIVAWREVAEPYQGPRALSYVPGFASGGQTSSKPMDQQAVRWDYTVERRFYVNGQDFFTDEKTIRVGDLRRRVRALGLPLAKDDNFVYIPPSRPNWFGRFVHENDIIEIQPDMKIEIDNIPF